MQQNEKLKNSIKILEQKLKEKEEEGRKASTALDDHFQKSTQLISQLDIAKQKLKDREDSQSLGRTKELQEMQAQLLASQEQTQKDSSTIKLMKDQYSTLEREYMESDDQKDSLIQD